MVKRYQEEFRKESPACIAVCISGLLCILGSFVALLFWGAPGFLCLFALGASLLIGANELHNPSSRDRCDFF